jgi:hypothetical protein
MRSDGSSAVSDRAELITAPDVVLLNTTETATATGFAEATLRKWACYKTRGALLPTVKRGGRNLYRPSDIRAWLGVDPVERAP